MKKINARQLIIFYFIYSFSIKFLMLPQLLAVGAGRDAWITAGLGAIIELAILFVVLLKMEKRADTKILMPFMFLFFLLQVLITLKHTNHLLGATLYETLNDHMFIIPMLILGVFFVFSKTRSVFRAGEVFYVLILIAIFLAVLPSLVKVDLHEPLPILSRGLSPVFRTLYNNLIYFEAAIVLLMFKGDVVIGKGFTRKFMIWAAIGAAVFIGFVFLFYSLFGPLSNLRTVGVVDITGQNAYIAQNGRIEWIIACVWILLLLIRFGVLFYCCFAAAKSIACLNKAKPAVIAFPLAGVIYALFLFVSLDSVLVWTRPFVLGFYILIPLLFLLMGFISRKKLEGKKNV